jgi:S1-C subfamily serine protease
VDSAIGAAVQAIAVLVAAWLLAIPLHDASQPQIAAAVSGSKVLGQVNDLAPQWLKTMPNRFSNLLNTSGLPDVMGPFTRAPVADVAPPDPGVLQSEVPRLLHTSVLRIHGIAPSCQRALEGSGFVVAPGRLITNAHVVAGTTSVSVDSARGTLAAKVVLFNPSVDIAVLDVPGLVARPLRLDPQPAHAGDSAIVLGYPNGGPYTASAARVRETYDLDGPNIYQDDTVDRQVYTLRGSVHPGNSGGPLVTPDGQVLGVVFGVDRSDPETGFALTLDEISAQLAAAPAAGSPVPTGPCVLG